MTAVNLSYENYIVYCTDILNQIKASTWRPDLVVGLTGSGLLAGQIIASDLGCDFQSLNWSGVDTRNCSDAGLAEEIVVDGIKVLIVDGASISGRTIIELKEDLDSCVRDAIDFEDQVRVAVLFSLKGSKEKTGAQYTAWVGDIDENEKVKMPWSK